MFRKRQEENYDVYAKYTIHLLKKMKNHMKTVLINFWENKKNKDMVSLNVLQCLDTIALRTLSFEIWIK